MNKTRYILTFGILLFFFDLCRAQVPGFLGKKITFKVGTSLNSPFINFGNSYLNESTDFSLLPPKLNTDIDFVISNRTALTIGGSFYPMPNTRFFVQNYNQSSGEETYVVDSFRLKTNMLSVGFGLKKFTEYAPYGLFWVFGVNYNSYTTTVYPTVYTQEKINGVVVDNSVEKFSTGTEITSNFSFYFGKGKQWIVNEKYVVDLCLKTYIFLGNKKAEIYYDFDHREHLSEIVDFVKRKKSNESHLIEISASFGILK